MRLRLLINCAISTATAYGLCGDAASAQPVEIFERAGIQFRGPDSFVGDNVVIQKSGRLVEKTISLPDFEHGSQLIGNLNVWGNEDPWDRAGSIRLVVGKDEDGADETVELHRFVTGFGGTTSHALDISALASQLNGEVTVQAYVDTWVDNAWQVDFSIESRPNNTVTPSTWFNNLVEGSSKWYATSFENGPIRAENVVVPDGLDKVELRYIATGHSLSGSLGTQGDEFVTRTHTIKIDGEEIAAFEPWRDDCRNFRSVNPTSGRWGSVWSSDFDRSGWCPGDDVEPMVFDVTDYLTPGEHTVEFFVDGIKPKDDFGRGYWRVSSYLTGESVVSSDPCDFNFDGTCDVLDLDSLLFEFLGTADETHDLDGSGIVDIADRDEWLHIAGHPSGDFNLNGITDSQDLNVIGTRWQTTDVTSFAQGDANGDGVVDSTDLNFVGRGWQQSAAASVNSVPEPRGPFATLLVLFLALQRNVGRRD